MAQTIDIKNNNLPKIYSSFCVNQSTNLFTDLYYNDLCIVDFNSSDTFLLSPSLTQDLNIIPFEFTSEKDILTYCLNGPEKEFIQGLYHPSASESENLSNPLGKIYIIRAQNWSPAHLKISSKQSFFSGEFNYLSEDVTHCFCTRIVSFYLNEDTEDYNFYLTFKKSSSEKKVYLEVDLVKIDDRTFYIHYVSDKYSTWKELFYGIYKDTEFLKYFQKESNNLADYYSFSDSIDFSKDVEEIYYFEGSKEISLNNNDTAKAYNNIFQIVNELNVSNVIFYSQSADILAPAIFNFNINKGLGEDRLFSFWLGDLNDNKKWLEDFKEVDNFLFFYNYCSRDDYWSEEIGYKSYILFGKELGRIFGQSPQNPCAYKDIDTQDLAIEITESELEEFSKWGVITTYWDADIQKFCLSHCVTSYDYSKEKIISDTCRTHSLQTKRILLQIQRTLIVAAKRDFFNEGNANRTNLSESYVEKWTEGILNGLLCSSNNTSNYILKYNVKNIIFLVDSIQITLEVSTNSEISRYFTLITNLKA